MAIVILAILVTLTFCVSFGVRIVFAILLTVMVWSFAMSIWLAVQVARLKRQMARLGVDADTQE